MILHFRVEKVANLRHKLFVPDPHDPEHQTVDSGLYLQELTLEVIPDEMRGGRGLMVIQINEADQIGRFRPGARVKVELTAERERNHLDDIREREGLNDGDTTKR